MSSHSQIEANRKNAKKSTGPKTPQGKAVAAQNALKHGLTANRNVVITENQAEFDLHRDALMEELDPQTMTESILAARIVSLSWRLQRAVNIQDQAIDAIDDQLKNGDRYPSRGAEEKRLDPALSLGRILYHDFANQKVFERLLNYEKTIETALYKTMKQLKSLQRQRTTTPTDHPASSIFKRNSSLDSSKNHSPSPINNQSSIANNQSQRRPEPARGAYLNQPAKPLNQQDDDTQNQPPNPRLAHGPVPWVPLDQNEPTASTQSTPAPTEIEHQVSSIEHPHDNMQDTTSDIPHTTYEIPSLKNKPNSKIPQTTAIPLIKRIYNQKAAYCNQQKQTQFQPAHLSRGDEAARSEHSASRSKPHTP